MLTDFSSEKQAKALSDHLEVGGIEVVVRGTDPYEIWVLDDDLVDKAEELIAGFDGHADQSVAAGAIRKTREAAAKPKAEIRVHASRDVALGSATMAFIIISATVALMSDLGETKAGAIEALMVTPGFEVAGEWKAYTQFQWSEPWRLLTPMFIHFGLMHLIFNMFWLYHFGNQIEAIHRTPRFLVLVALFVIPGNLMQLELIGPGAGGMSGVNYGLFGFVWMQARYAKSGYGIENREVVILMVWLVLCVSGILGPFLGPIANVAHAVGLILGIMAGVPAYLHFRKTHNMSANFEKGSWADLNIVGWQRFEQRYLKPYAPAWFVLVAMAVLLIDAA